MPEKDIATGRLRLDIEEIPKELYQLLLAEFTKQFGDAYYTEWEISAEKVEESEDL